MTADAPSNPDNASAQPNAHDSAEPLVTPEKVREAIRPVKDPELFISIVDLGLFYGAEVSADGKKVTVQMTLTSPMCPAGPELISEIKRAISGLPGVEEILVDLVWEPAWDPRFMASDEAKDILGLW